MKYTDRKRYACYESPFLAMSFRVKDAALMYLGLDGGGRKPDHKNTYDLLKPSFGAHPLMFDDRRKAPARVSHGENGFRASGATGAFAFEPRDERSFELSFAAPKGAALPRAFFNASLAIAVAPPTIWADTAQPDLSHGERRRPTNGKGVQSARTWSLPALVHFPDYGTLRIEAVDCDADMREELIESKEMAGLNLGFQNMGGHPRFVALHHGISKLTFRLRSPAKKARLRFTVEKEISPAAPFLKDPKWNAFRRHWLDNFALNRDTLSMGDHIGLTGIAHLCIHNKADMLALCDPKDNPVFGRIRNHLVRTIDASLAYCQAFDGEISWEYWRKPKAPDRKTCAFTDCTFSNVIAALVALDFAPDRTAKWLDAIVRGADFLLSLDKDGDGLLELPNGGTKFNDDWKGPYDRSRIWWDNIAFGHKDAWTNLHAHRAFRLLVPVLRANGRAADAERFEKFLREFPAKFRLEFYNPESGLVAGWRDVEGRLHDYHFTFPTALAVTEKIFTRAESRRMLRRIFKYMKEAGFGDNRYGIPGNTLPIATDGDTFAWEFMAGWPRYENGGCCGMTAWHFLNALYSVGMDKEADDIFFRMLDTHERLPMHSGLFPGYMESIDWRTKDGNPCGYNYLADNYTYLAAGFLHHAKKSHPFFA